MSAGDALVVGEDWISEYYFTSDVRSQNFQAEVLARRKEWDAAEGVATTRSRFLAARRDLETALAGLSAQEGVDTTDAREVYRRLLDVLGYATGQHALKTEGSLTHVWAPGISIGAPLVLVDARPVETVEDLLVKDAPTLLEPWTVDERTTLASVPRALSTLFVADTGPLFALVFAGRWLLLAERDRWHEGRYLAVDLQLVCERNDARRGGEIDRTLTCLDAQSLAPDADGDVWWTRVLAESVKHTVGVSKDLREGVRASIEIIANEVVTRRRDRGLPPLPADQAQVLAKQSLRFLYRILFLLYAEASPELGVLPVGVSEYEQGYSLARLRDLVQVELATPRARCGTHLYESLAVLFHLVDRGHPPVPEDEESLVSPGPDAVRDAESPDIDEIPQGRDDTEDIDPLEDVDSPEEACMPAGLEFQCLRADLFLPRATALIDEVGLGNAALQDVLQHLLLSKESRGKDRGFISYAELGINQLGAVYEGLMSYTGFFAVTDLYEVAKGGDSSKGSWVVPVERAAGIAASDFVLDDPDPRTGERRPVHHKRGSFVFRLAGRERQQSASYYTPEVLTRFTVSQALEELLDQDGAATTPEEILGLTVCEPALGSGAFAIEAVRQLAEQYLRRRERELGRRIDPDERPRRLQEVKAYLALHNVYGVDLNATAVELAEISLWLDTMVSGLQAPWFGLHLRRGNSLIGARRATYSRAQINDKSWLTSTPQDAPLTGLVDDLADDVVARSLNGRIHHFLLPAEGWGSATEAKEAKALAPERTAALNTWRRSVRTKLSRKQVDALAELSHQVETLWQVALRRLQIAESEARRAIPLWGRDAVPAGGAVQREEIEASLADPDGAYQRLRRVMDVWCALWFWPLTGTGMDMDGVLGAAAPPSVDEWIATCHEILGRNPEARSRCRKAPGAATLVSAMTWDELGEAERLLLDFAGTRRVDRVLAEHPWLDVCEQVAAQQGFFHWELDFATVLARGGFDLQVGNPPWVRPRSDVDALLAEGDPWWQLALKPSEAERKARRGQTLALPGIRDLVLDGTVDIAATAAYVGSVVNYPYLVGLQPDLYRCFMEQTWSHVSGRGTIGLIHLESHFTDEKAGVLRGETYRRLCRHWQFINELHLFEIGNQKRYGVSVYGNRRSVVNFQTATSLYHPDTVVRSMRHDGNGDEPGIKGPDGNWDLRPHRNRITTVDNTTLRTWHAVLEDPHTPVTQTRMIYTVNSSSAEVLDCLTRWPRMGSLELRFSRGWDESIDRKRKRFEKSWGAPSSWDDVIYQGAHLYVSNPFYQSRNSSMAHHRDWCEIDLESLFVQAIPTTSYKPCGDRYEYDCAYTDWGNEEHPSPARDYYRVAWRTMAANNGERTLMPAIIPPGAAHVDGVHSLGACGTPSLLLASIVAQLSSLTYDYLIRVTPKSTIRSSAIMRLPIIRHQKLSPMLAHRALRLNCLVDAYSDLWQESWNQAFVSDTWTGGLVHPLRRLLGDVGPEWTADTPLRIAADRRQALVEIDALVALALGVTADQLCTIYRTQFPVLYSYDRNRDFYDANGRIVPNSVLTMYRKKGEHLSVEERMTTNPAGSTYTYELPFVTLDRETDMRRAYAHFERLLAERS